MGWLIEFFSGGLMEGGRREEGGGWVGLDFGKVEVGKVATYLTWRIWSVAGWWWWRNSKGRKGSLEVEIVLTRALST